MTTSTRKRWEKKARTVACPTCDAQPWITELSHWKRMEAALGGGPDWWRKVVGVQ